MIRRRLQDEALGPEIERLHNGIMVLRARYDDHRDARVTVAQLPERRQAVPMEAVQIENHKTDIDLFGEEPHRLGAIHGLEDNGIAFQLPEDAAKRLPNEEMSTDQQRLHWILWIELAPNSLRTLRRSVEAKTIGWSDCVHDHLQGLVFDVEVFETFSCMAEISGAGFKPV